MRLEISGMTCEHCAKTVKRALESVNGVVKADVYFPQGFADVEGDVNVDELIKAVQNAGYGAKLLEKKDINILKNNIDIVIIGGGSAGFAAAIKAVELGAKPLVVEQRTIGGTCLNRGCVPSKFLIEVANSYYSPLKNPFKGIVIKREHIDWKEIVSLKNELLNTMRKEKYWDVLEAYPNIVYKDCRGEFISGNEVMIGSKNMLFDKAIIATGSSPGIPPITGLHKVRYFTSDDIFDIDYLPEHLIVVGGSAVGLELSQAFLRLGSKVTLIEMLPRLAFKEEQEISMKIEELLKEEGMEIFTDAEISEVFQNGNIIGVKFKVNATEQTIKGSDILIATGRVPNTKNLGLLKANIESDTKGFVKVNEFLQTTNLNVYAAGDCVGKLPLVTVAALEAHVAVENMLTGNNNSIDYISIPHAIFTDPEIASVGLTEEQAIQKGHNIESRILDLEKVPRAKVSFNTNGFIKMVVDKDSKKVLGIHTIMPHSAEIIHKGVMIIKHALTLEDIILAVDVYPTLSEAIKLCAQSFSKDVSKLSCCAV